MCPSKDQSVGRVSHRPIGALSSPLLRGCGARAVSLQRRVPDIIAGQRVGPDYVLARPLKGNPRHEGATGLLDRGTWDLKIITD